MYSVKNPASLPGIQEVLSEMTTNIFEISASDCDCVFTTVVQIFQLTVGLWEILILADLVISHKLKR
jgi:hypothetical protein